jgi:hypothetical protein
MASLRLARHLLPVLTCAALLAAPVRASNERPFGPVTFKGTGNTVLVQRTFTVANGPAAYTLRVAQRGIAAASLTLNDRLVLSGPLPKLSEWPVTLVAGVNSITVEFTAPSGAALEVEIARRDAASDTTPPVVTATASPPSGPAGWNNTPVTVTFTCSDVGSGIASCPSPVVVSSDGANQLVSGTAIDRAGNSATAAATVSLDTISPTVSVALSPPPNPSGVYVVPVTAHFTCADAGSGLLSCEADRLISMQGANQTVSGAATDRAGNTATVTSDPFTIDFSLATTNEELTQVRTEPPQVPSGVPTTVTVSIETSPDAPIVASTIRLTEYDGELRFVADRGPMFDDGTHGDETPLDGTFTVAFDIARTGPAAVVFRITATRQGAPEAVGSPPFLLPVLADDSPAVLRAEIAAHLRSRDRSAVYQRLGADLTSDLALDEVADSTLDGLAQAMTTCDVTRAAAAFEVCVARGLHAGLPIRYEFFSMRDLFGIWRLISW